MHNFLITGHGRSGTQFLSKVMNLSKQWTVLHEPPPRTLDATIEDVQSNFDRNYYGEVNSVRRLLLFDLEVSKKGVLVRNPYDVWISAMNRSASRAWPIKMIRLRHSLQIIDKAINTGIQAIQFSLMVTDLNYLDSVLKDFGISDVQLESRHLSPVNNTKKKKYTSLDHMTKEMRKELDGFCEPFIEKHLS